MAAEGDPVHVNYQGEGQWFPGVIAKMYPDDTYDIRFDDGDFEEDVEPERIQFTTLAASAFHEGEAVEAAEVTEAADESGEGTTTGADSPAGVVEEEEVYGD